MDQKKALTVCEGHDGPVSNICKAGLDKAGKGVDRVEKAIENAGSLEMAFLEKNMGWLTAVVAIAPMMGFTGTVWGMIKAFDAIEAANDIFSSRSCWRYFTSTINHCFWFNNCYDNPNLSKLFFFSN